MQPLPPVGVVTEVVDRATDSFHLQRSNLDVSGKFPLSVCVDGIAGVLFNVHPDRRSVIRCIEAAYGTAVDAPCGAINFGEYAKVIAPGSA